MNYIEQNYSQEITLKKAAELMGYEPCHCSKIFKKLTGMNFISYLNNVRIKKAIEKIHWTDHSITQIAFECGFHNVRNFNRVFKTVTGQSPTGFLNTIFQTNGLCRVGKLLPKITQLLFILRKNGIEYVDVLTLIMPV